MSLSDETTTRRVVLAGAGAAAVVVLTGCQTYDQRNAGPAGNQPAGSNPTDKDDDDDTGIDTLAQTSDVPVGGGIVLDRQAIVITQPKAGTFKAFTATCTHQGCTVAEVKNGTINCPCHGSKFKMADGSVANGPATRGLREIGITVNGATIQRS